MPVECRISYGEFEKIFAKLDSRFKNGNQSKDDFKQLYYEELKNLTTVAWFDIVRRAIRDLRTMPTPGELLGFWYEYLKTHPELVQTDVVDEWCDYCEGRGSFGYIRYKNNNTPYEFISKCPHCRNLGSTNGLPEWDEAEIKRRGFQVVKHGKAQPNEVIKDMDTLVDISTGEIRDNGYDEWLKTQ